MLPDFVPSSRTKYCRVGPNLSVLGPNIAATSGPLGPNLAATFSPGPKMAAIFGPRDTVFVMTGNAPLPQKKPWYALSMGLHAITFECPCQ